MKIKSWNSTRLRLGSRHTAAGTVTRIKLRHGKQLLLPVFIKQVALGLMSA